MNIVFLYTMVIASIKVLMSLLMHSHGFKDHYEKVIHVSSHQKQKKASHLENARLGYSARTRG